MIKGILNIPFVLRPVAVLGLDQNRYVASVDNYTTISYEDIVQYASKAAHIPASDISMAMDALYDALSYFVCNGHAVKLPQLGTFHFGINAKAYEDETKAGADAVYQTKLMFTPIMELRTILDNIAVKTVAMNPNGLAENMAAELTKASLHFKPANGTSYELLQGRYANITDGGKLTVRLNGPIDGALGVFFGGLQGVCTLEKVVGSTYVFGYKGESGKASAAGLRINDLNPPKMVYYFTTEPVSTPMLLSAAFNGQEVAVWPADVMKRSIFSKEVFVNRKANNWLQVGCSNAANFAANLSTAIYLTYDGVRQTDLALVSSWMDHVTLSIPEGVNEVKIGASEDNCLTIHLVGDADPSGTRTPAISTLTANGVSARTGESSTVNVGGTYNFELNGLNLDLLPDSAIKAPAGAVVTVTEKTSQRIRFTMANAQAGTFKVVNGSVTLFQMTLTAYQAAEGAATVTSIGSVANGGSMYQTAAQNVTKVVAGTNLSQLTKDNFSLTNGSIVSFSGSNLVANFNGGNGTLRVTVSGSVIYQCTVTATSQGGYDDDGGFGI